MVIAFMIAHYWHIERMLPVFSWGMIVVLFLTFLFLYISNAYTPDYTNKGARIIVRTLFGVVGAAVAVLVYSYITRTTETDPIYWRGTFLVGYALFLPYACISRVLISKAAFELHESRKWIVIGDAEHITKFASTYNSAGLGGKLVAIELNTTSNNSENVERALALTDLEGIVIATSKNRMSENIEKALMKKRLSGVRVYAVIDFCEHYLWKIPIDFLEESWIVLSQGFDLVHHKVQLNIKRFLDFVFSLCGLIAFSPVLIAVTVLVRLNSKGPAIFRQIRTGKDGTTFTLYKFRTMQQGADSSGPQWAQERDPRVTSIGKILRKFRIDELPQLWNVLKGEMSFIGPRPEVPDFVAKLHGELPYYDLRLLVAPGITGWAQVMYPYGASVEDAKEKLQYDLYYIKNYSIALDVLIALKTLRVVFYAAGR